jgi:prepilin-type N-terminal cleavage/methylation domain-containing protein
VSRLERTGDRRRSRTQRGTTLIETIVATTILAILATTALGGVLFGISQTRVTFNRASAAAWVEAEFDFLRLKGYLGLSAGTRTLTQTTGYTTLGAISEPTIPTFFDHADVAVVCAPPVSNCATLAVYQVTITLYTGPTTSFAVLSTYISSYSHS